MVFMSILRMIFEKALGLVNESILFFDKDVPHCGTTPGVNHGSLCGNYRDRFFYLMSKKFSKCAYLNEIRLLVIITINMTKQRVWLIV